jgi:hypothetical protein
LEREGGVVIGYLAKGTKETETIETTRNHPAEITRSSTQNGNNTLSQTRTNRSLLENLREINKSQNPRIVWKSTTKKYWSSTIWRLERFLPAKDPMMLRTMIPPLRRPR